MNKRRIEKQNDFIFILENKLTNLDRIAIEENYFGFISRS